MKKRLSYIFPAAFILLPAILFGVITLIQCGGSAGGFSLPMPKWNDEAAYYELIKTWMDVRFCGGSECRFFMYCQHDRIALV